MRVLTIGTFDLLHVGHLRLFERAAAYGDLTVGVNSDRFVTRYKGQPPAEPQLHRLMAIRDHGYRAWLNDGPGIDLILEHNPDLLVIGHDWLGLDYPSQLGTTADVLARRGVAVLFLPRTPGVSTTELRAA